MRKMKNSPEGIGVDIVSLSRVDDFLKKHRASLGKILSPEERIKVENASNPARILAYFFSAKEAVFKSLDLDWLGVEGFRMIEIIIPEKEEEPSRARLSGLIHEKVNARLKEWHLAFLEFNGFIVAQAIGF